MIILNNKSILRKLPTLAAVFIFCLSLSSEPAHAFGRKPVAVPNTPEPQTPTPQPSEPGDVIRARWESKNRDGASWSQHVYDTLPTLAANLLKKDPADIASFCPAYSDLSTSDKKNFWVYLISGMTELESNQDPATTYTEKFTDAKGNRVISRGLLQISIESGNSYGCGFKSADELHDPIKNLDCGLRIMNKWIGADGRIQGYAAHWLGAARYWSTLRASKANIIQGWTKALRMCGK